MLRKTGVLYNSAPLARSLRAIRTPSGYKTVGFAQAPAQFKEPAGYTRARVSRPPSPHPAALRSGGRLPFFAFREITRETPSGLHGRSSRLSNATIQGARGTTNLRERFMIKYSGSRVPLAGVLSRCRGSASANDKAVYLYSALFSSRAAAYNERGSPRAIGSVKLPALRPLARAARGRVAALRKMPVPVHTYRNNSRIFHFLGKKSVLDNACAARRETICLNCLQYSLDFFSQI